MKMKIREHMIVAKVILSIIIISNVCVAHGSNDNHIIKDKFRVVVVSCAKIKKVCPQFIWQQIGNLKPKPQLLLFLGDIVYLDSNHRKVKDLKKCKDILIDEKKGKKRVTIDEMFEIQWNEKNFKALIRRVPYFAMWDDHDAGHDDIKPNVAKELDGFGFPQENGKRDHIDSRIGFTKRIYNRNALKLYSDIGIYEININGNNGSPLKNKGNFNGLDSIDYSFMVGGIQFIMLDGTSSRSDTSILSLEQFRWLEDKLNSHRDKGLSVVSTGASLELSSSNWGWKKGYRTDYEELKRILNKYNNVIVLTGDIHRNATIPKNTEKNFYELVSSGVAYSNEKKDNYLILDISSNSLNEWNIEYRHYGIMDDDFGSTDGIITIPESK